MTLYFSVRLRKYVTPSVICFHLLVGTTGRVHNVLVGTQCILLFIYLSALCSTTGYLRCNKVAGRTFRRSIFFMCFIEISNLVVPRPSF